jgi:hypothetical protein
VLLLALRLAGCAGDAGARYFLALRWSLADGRSCADAGIARLHLRESGSLATLTEFVDCEAGRIGSPIAEPRTVGQVPGGERAYDLDALSGEDGVLYTGHFEVDAAERAEVDVLLRFVGRGP